ncbi:MAG: endonuclease [Prevotellaceae bacterium]|jgi:endonuclease I|nr:endonuclease [Prevotellaceae bacterium]
MNRFKSLPHLRKQKTGLLVFAFLLFSCTVWTQAPAGYYNSAEGKNREALKTALHNIIKAHTKLSYSNMPTYFLTTDWHPDGYLWDMYSNNRRTVWDGSLLNREHNMPKSWWGSNGKEVAYSDLHNLYPSDAPANGQKGNLPLGEAGTASFSNGVVKTGANSFTGYDGKVFEPADIYKGDFARVYMYMVTCYEDYSSAWQSVGVASMLQNNTYPTLNPYAVSLLLKWHEQDPVSQKETDRNNAVYSHQGNRNPFIDRPEFAELIWNGNTSVKNRAIPVYFNAVTNKLTIRIDYPSDYRYQIYNISGTLVAVGELNDSAAISTGNFTAGLYLLSVFSENWNESRTAKFVILP